MCSRFLDPDHDEKNFQKCNAKNNYRRLTRKLYGTENFSFRDNSLNIHTKYYYQSVVQNFLHKLKTILLE